MATDNFFTTLQNYFKCCFWCRSECCCFSEKPAKDSESSSSSSSGSVDLGIGDSSPYSFDDLSSPLSPMTSSSSGSSLDNLYKRPKFKPYVGIIPANYYSD